MSARSDIYQSAVKLFQQEFFDESLRVTEYGLRHRPNDARLWELKGLIHRIQQDAEACLHALQQAGERTRLRPVAKCALADCLAYYGNMLKARQLYLCVYDDPFVSADTLQSVAEGLAYIEEWSLCAMVCREWCHERPTDSRSWFQCAFAVANSGGDPDEILPIAWKGVHHSDDQLSYRISFAILMTHLGKPDYAYQFVSSLSRYDLSLAGCTCAVRHLRDIYNEVQDQQRHDWCEKLLNGGCDDME